MTREFCPVCNGETTRIWKEQYQFDGILHPCKWWECLCKDATCGFCFLPIESEQRIDNAHVMILLKERDVMRERLAIAREFIYEVSLPKFKDSDADSLLETLRRNAINFIEATNKP